MRFTRSRLTWSVLVALLALFSQGGKACGYIPKSTYDKAVQTARAFGIPHNLFIALIWVESRFCENARGRAGEVGLGQVLPTTARSIEIPPHYLSHPDWNLYASAKYLRLMYERFRNWEKALIAYNAGPGRVNDPPTSSRRYARNVLYVYEYLEKAERIRARR